MMDSNAAPRRGPQKYITCSMHRFVGTHSTAYMLEELPQSWLEVKWMSCKFSCQIHGECPIRAMKFEEGMGEQSYLLGKRITQQFWGVWDAEGVLGVTRGQSQCWK